MLRWKHQPTCAILTRLAGPLNRAAFVIEGREAGCLEPIRRMADGMRLAERVRIASLWLLRLVFQDTFCGVLPECCEVRQSTLQIPW